jgi:hypothetical protein
MRVYKKTPVIVLTLVAAMLGACSTVGPPVLERAVLGYDETNARLSDQMLLLNIARWHEGEGLHLTVTSSIAATFDWTATAGIGAQLEDSSGTDFFNFNLGGRASENPTFSILPLQGEEYVTRLLKPFTEDVVSLTVFQGDTPIDRMLRLMAEGIEFYGSKGEIERSITNSPGRPQEYAEFRRMLLHLRWLAESRQLFARPLVFEDILFKDIADRPKAEDLAKGINLGITWRQKPDGRFMASKLTQGRVAITNYDPMLLSDEQRWALNERIKRLPASVVYVDLAPGYPGGNIPFTGGIRLRSFGEIIRFVADGMGEFPEFDVLPDPRTGIDDVAIENRAATLTIAVTEKAPPDRIASILYRGHYYSISDTKWDRGNFRLLALLNQTTVGDLKGIGIPITIAK